MLTAIDRACLSRHELLLIIHPSTPERQEPARCGDTVLRRTLSLPAYFGRRGTTRFPMVT